jgi:hypothetical protein
MTGPIDRAGQPFASAMPLAYFALAHAALAAALLVLAVDPALPGGFFYHPKMIALTHLVTLGWLTGSILGALYIVWPLALGCPLPVSRVDWIAWAAYVIGVAGMVSHFWIATYGGMVWSAALVTGGAIPVAVRAARGLRAAKTPWPIALHVRLAFFNALAAAAAGALIGLDRTMSLSSISPLASAYAHAHLAAIGWVALLVVGLSYRLIPMMLPCAMPSGSALAWSALFVESGLAVIIVTLMSGSAALPIGAALVAAGFASAAVQLRRASRDRRPRPPRLPATDWSMRQARVAAMWLAVAAALGLFLSLEGATSSTGARIAWVYGVAGLVGWLAQMVAAVQGRLLPLFLWYHARARRGTLPERSVHELPSAPLAMAVFLGWAAGVPLLAAGLAGGSAAAIRAAAVSLLVGVLAGGAHVAVMRRRAL